MFVSSALFLSKMLVKMATIRYEIQIFSFMLYLSGFIFILTHSQRITIMGCAVVCSFVDRCW